MFVPDEACCLYAGEGRGPAHCERAFSALRSVVRGTPSYLFSVSLCVYGADLLRSPVVEGTELYDKKMCRPVRVAAGSWCK